MNIQMLHLLSLKAKFLFIIGYFQQEVNKTWGAAMKGKYVLTQKNITSILREEVGQTVALHVPVKESPRKTGAVLCFVGDYAAAWSCLLCFSLWEDDLVDKEEYHHGDTGVEDGSADAESDQVPQGLERHVALAAEHPASALFPRQ